MNTVEHIRCELRSIQVSDYVERIRAQLSRCPNDADLRWALAELERTDLRLASCTPPERRRRRR